MKDIRYEELANCLLTYSVKIQKDEDILVEIIGKDTKKVKIKDSKSLLSFL